MRKRVSGGIIRERLEGHLKLSGDSSLSDLHFKNRKIARKPI